MASTAASLLTIPRSSVLPPHRSTTGVEIRLSCSFCFSISLLSFRRVPVAAKLLSHVVIVINHPRAASNAEDKTARSRGRVRDLVIRKRSSRGIATTIQRHRFIEDHEGDAEDSLPPGSMRDLDLFLSSRKILPLEPTRSAMIRIRVALAGRARDPQWATISCENSLVYRHRGTMRCN